jgi:hypothetical protein
MLLCAAVQLCLNRDAPRHVAGAARDCADLSHTAATSTCAKAQALGATFLDVTREIRDDLKTGFSGKHNLDASVFVKIKDLMEQKKATRALSCLKDMDDLAVSLLQQAQGMHLALNRGIESLPDVIKDEFAVVGASSAAAAHQQSTPPKTATATTTTTADNYRAMDPSDDDETTRHSRDQEPFGGNDAELVRSLQGAMATLDDDVVELDNACSTQQQRGSSGGGINLFSAATKGSAVLELTATKGLSCRTLWTQMQELCGTISRVLAQTILSSSSNCCVLAVSVAGGIASLFRCKSLVQLLLQAAQAVQRLVAALSNLLSSVWQRFQGFFDEFGAAKKLGRFVTGIQNSKVGKLIASGTDGQGLMSCFGRS